MTAVRMIIGQNNKLAQRGASGDSQSGHRAWTPLHSLL